MTASRVFDKSKLPSRHVSVGPASAPHRSYYYAMGMTEQEIAQPFVGVATTWNEAAPCNIALARQAQAAKKGVKAAGGTPREFTTITVTDGIAMGHAGMKSSLVSREIIADSVELTMRGHCYDALVGLAGCDKSLPGLMMAMVRLNVPSVFMYGGSILPGRFRGKDVTVVDVFEAVGMHSVGNMSDEDLHERIGQELQVSRREDVRIEARVEWDQRQGQSVEDTDAGIMTAEKVDHEVGEVDDVSLHRGVIAKNGRVDCIDMALIAGPKEQVRLGDLATPQAAVRAGPWRRIVAPSGIGFDAPHLIEHPAQAERRNRAVVSIAGGSRIVRVGSRHVVGRRLLPCYFQSEGWACRRGPLHWRYGRHACARGVLRTNRARLRSAV